MTITLSAICLPIAATILWVVLALLPVRQPDHWGIAQAAKVVFCACCVVATWLCWFAYWLGTRAY